MTTTAIGFANKFYTLWTITDECKPLGNGRTYKVTHYNYIKNISMDKETALAKYPNAILDENLKGMSRSWSSKPQIIWDNVDTFRFGKYSDMKIDDVSDTNYIAWYWDNVYEDHRDYVGKVLESRGYEIREWGAGNKYLVSPEELEEEKARELEKNNTLNLLAKNEPFTINLDHNPNEDGDCRIGDVIYHFQEVKENYYQGWSYYLPVLNGKQKRIKNKNLVIKNYTYKVEDNGLITVEIINFEISK